MARTVFLDFEASSLAKASWPVEVAWVFDDGTGESHLVQPAPGWTDWDGRAEGIHGVALARLQADGVPHDVVAARMVEQLKGHALYATAPSWDGKWLSVLLRSAGLPRHALRLEDTTLAHRRIVAQVLTERGVPAPQRETLMQTVVDRMVLEIAAPRTPVHRARADAEHELALWRKARQWAEEASDAEIG